MSEFKDFTTEELFDALDGYSKVIQLFTREIDAVNGYVVETPYSNLLLNLRDAVVGDYEITKNELVYRKEVLTEEQLHLTSGLKNK